jgi:hypothetical protein
VLLVQGPAQQGATDAARDRAQGSTAQSIPEHSAANTTGDRSDRAIPASAAVRIITPTGLSGVMRAMRVAAIGLAMALIALGQRRCGDRPRTKGSKSRKRDCCSNIDFLQHKSTLFIHQSDNLTVAICKDHEHRLKAAFKFHSDLYRNGDMPFKLDFPVSSAHSVLRKSAMQPDAGLRHRVITARLPGEICGRTRTGS